VQDKSQKFNFYFALYFVISPALPQEYLGLTGGAEFAIVSADLEKTGDNYYEGIQ
jgi:hypothetical protein